jgi:hypothetical protein
LDAKIDFRKLESDGFDVKIESKFGQFLQVYGQHGVVPRGPVREFVVGQHVCSGLGLGQMFQTDDGDLRAAGELGSLQAAMAGDNMFVLIDQNRRIEPERFDAPGDRSKLCPIVLARIAWVGIQIGGRQKRELTQRGWRVAPISTPFPEAFFRLEMRIA